MAIASRSTSRSRDPRRSRAWFPGFVSFLLLLSAAGAVVLAGKVGLRLIIDPDAGLWLNPFLPASMRMAQRRSADLQTLAEIHQSIRQQGLIPGEAILLTPATIAVANPTTATTADWLIPVLAETSQCQMGAGLDQERCQQIVELRVYQPAQSPRSPFRKEHFRGSDPYFWLVSQLAITGPEESLVIAPFTTARSAHQGSTKALPLTRLERFPEPVPRLGIWLNLQGQWLVGSSSVAYGQVIHYNPDRSYLSVMLPWITTTGLAPQWRSLVAGGDPELVVDQTIDLEPNFRVYQVKPRKFVPNPLQLEEVSMLESASNDRHYRLLLGVARSGLWSTALPGLRTLHRQTDSRSWSVDLTAQLQVIEMHAAVTHRQAEKTWGNPGQQTLALLIDGRWTPALQVFQQSYQNRVDVAMLLKADTGRLWSRVNAALRLKADQPDVLAWGAMLVSLQRGRSAALTWLREQSSFSHANLQRVQGLLSQLEIASGRLEGNILSQIVGSAQSLPEINPSRWPQPNSRKLPKLEPGQAWYQVQVAAFHDGKRWRRSPFFELPAAANMVDELWAILGLNNDSQMQVTVWTTDTAEQSLNLAVHSVRVEGGALYLLASGEPLPKVSGDHRRLPPPLASTGQSFQWLQPDTLTLADLNQQQPERTSKILQQIWKELQRSGNLLPSIIPDPEQMLEQGGAGGWNVQQVELTKANQMATLLTLNADNLVALRDQPNSHPPLRSQTMIFAPSGQLIYSEFSNERGQGVLGIIDLGDRNRPALLIYRNRGYRVARWSASNQRFE